jgi:hypothetical protein
MTTLEARLTALAARIGPNRLRAARHAMILVGLFALPYVIILNRAKSEFGFDAYAYWSIDLGDLYGRSFGNTSGYGAFRYTPPIGQAFSVFDTIPWELFFGLWFAGMIAALIWLTGWTWLVLLALPPLPLELYHGNVHLFMAVAIVLGFRYPVAWAFIVLLKVSPGVGALWFAFRREWRSFGIAVGATLAIAGVSFVVAPGLWREYTATMLDNLAYVPVDQPHPFPIPLALRLAASVAIVWWGARTDRRWTVPIAATISLPIVWIHGLTLLIAAIPLWHADRARSRQEIGGRAVAPAEAFAAQTHPPTNSPTRTAGPLRPETERP